MRIRIKIRQRKTAWRLTSRGLVAAGAMAAVAAGFNPALAQSAGVTGPFQRPQLQGALPIHRFEIPPGPLEIVLLAFRHATGLQVTFGREGLASIESPGVTGVLTTEAALQQLLSATGVTYRFVSASAVMIDLAGHVESVRVIERLGPSSIKYTAPLRDTPQTVMVIPNSLIEQQAATTLRDVLRNVPGLTMTAGEGGAPAGDNLTLRGFSARNDLFVDGVRDLGPQTRDPFNMEQVEVAKGPSSALSGRGSAGGAINMTSKAPLLGRMAGGSVNLGSDDTRRFTADLNVSLQPLGMGERSAVRLNALAHDSDVAGRNVVTNNRWGLAPSLALGLGTPTRLTLSYYRLDQDNTPDYGIPWVTATHNVLAAFRDQPAPVPRENYYGLRDRDRERTGADMGTVRFEHDFSDQSGVRNQFRYGRSTRDSITTAPRFASNDNLVINRNGPSWITADEIWDNQSDLRAGLRTAGVSHSFVAGAALSRENNIRRTRTVTGGPGTTLYDPDPDQPFNGTITLSPAVGNVSGNSQALYAFDTARLGRRCELTGGFRWERFAVDGVNTALAPVERVDTMLSVRAGAVYKPRENGSVYASYGTSLSPSLEGLSYGVFNTAIEPEKTYTLEAGTKWDVAGDRLSLTAAAFRVEKTNARTPGVLPDDPPQVLEGRQRVAGIEIGGAGNITPSLQVFGAYTFMDGKIIRSNVPAEVGRNFQNAPKNSFSAWITWRHKRLTLAGGPRFIGRRFGNNINTRAVDSYATLDALGSFAVNRRLDVRLNVFNLNNAYYFDRLGGGHLIPGAARSVNVSTHFRF